MTIPDLLSPHSPFSHLPRPTFPLDAPSALNDLPPHAFLAYFFWSSLSKTATSSDLFAAYHEAELESLLNPYPPNQNQPKKQ